MAGTALEPAAPLPGAGVCVHADRDETLVGLWLDGRPDATQAAYRRDVAAFLGWAGVELRRVTLGQVQGWSASLDGMAPASRARKVAAVKSLFGFALRLGYVQFDVAQAVRLPAVRNVLAERIMTEAEAQRMVALEPNPRNHALLRVLYGCGLRVSEACGLRWRDLRGTKAGGQASVFGKGGKTRVVLVQPKLWRLLQALRGDAGPDAAVFASRRGDVLDRSQAHRVVKAAARRAGLGAEVSAHWLRHAHASHSLDHGAPLHVVQGSLGHGSLQTTTKYVHARPGDGSAKYLPE